MTWFKTGRKMKNAAGDEIECTVQAENEQQYDQYIAQGWKPVTEDKPAPSPGTDIEGVTGLTTQKKQGRPKKNV